MIKSAPIWKTQAVMMIDQAKRKTLKHVAAIGVGTVAFTTSHGTLASSAFVQNPGNSKTARAADEGLAQIRVGTRHASKTNDLEVVITNTSNTNVTITSMTPAEINTVRGRFDFNSLFDSGDLQLASGESITVPIQHHSVVLDGSSVDKRATQLTHSLRRNVSIVTNADSFAATTITNFTNLA